jgi:hypothetical protein
VASTFSGCTLGTAKLTDYAVLQEVKLTCDLSLAYASALATDYGKLFGDDPQFTLATRLESAKNELEFVKGMPHLVPRVTAMSGTSPQTVSRVRHVPTLVHDYAAPDPEAPAGNGMDHRGEARTQVG